MKNHWLSQRDGVFFTVCVGNGCYQPYPNHGLEITCMPSSRDFFGTCAGGRSSIVKNCEPWLILWKWSGRCRWCKFDPRSTLSNFRPHSNIPEKRKTSWGFKPLEDLRKSKFLPSVIFCKFSRSPMLLEDSSPIVLIFFPTCQVRAVRFYQRCLRSRAPPLLPAPSGQPRTSTIFIYIYISDKMSELMSNRMKEFLSDRRSECMSGRMSKCMSDSMSNLMLDRMSDFMSDRMSDKISEFMSNRMKEFMSDRVSKLMSDRMSEDMSDRMSEKVSDRTSKCMSDRMSKLMSDRMSELMADRMSDRMPEWMSDRMSDFMSELKSGRMSELMWRRMSDRMSEMYVR